MRFITALLFLFSSWCCAQNVDSLKLALSSGVDDTVEVNIYYQLFKAYEYSNPKKAIAYSKKLLKHPMNQEPYYQARNYIDLGKVFKNVGQFDSAVAYMLQGIEIAEKHDDLKNQSMGYNSLGVIYKKNSDLEKAIRYYRASNKACTQLNFTKGMAMTLNNIGTIHDALENADSALFYYKKAMNIAEKNKLIGAQAVSYNNIGEILAKEGKESEALSYFYKTLVCDSITNNLMGMSYTLFNIVTCQKILGEIDAAFKTIERAEKNAQKINSKQIDLLYQRSLADLLESKGNYKAALKAQKKFKALSDSVYNNQKSEQIAEMEAKYESEKKELEIQNLSQENEIKELDIQRKNGIILAALALVFLGALLSYFFVSQLRAKQKQKMTEAVLLERDKGIAALFAGIEEERKRIAQGLHDGVGQQLSSLKLSMEHLKSKAINEDKDHIISFELLVKKIDDACKEVREISHQMLPKTLIEKGVLSAIEDMMEHTLNGTGINYSLEHYQLRERLPENIELTLFRICQELINNTIKHAKASEIVVQLIRSKNNVVLIVEDNGQGFDQKKSSDGIGLLNLTSRLNTIKGEVSYESSPGSGTSATIRIPLI